jgi:hypothetical protein
MDNLAKRYWNETQPVVQPFYIQNTSGWSLWIEDRKLSTWDQTSLYNHAQSYEILEHWSKRQQIPGNKITSIDWEASEMASERLGLKLLLWIPKWLAGFERVRKVQQRNKYQDHAKCPRCTEFEDAHHILVCKAIRATTQWAASISKIDIWLSKSNTMPDLRRAIVRRLHEWRSEERFQDSAYTWPGVNDLIRDQDQVGWRTFLEGGMLQNWAAKQQEYYTWLQKHNTGKRWATTLINPTRTNLDTSLARSDLRRLLASLHRQ